MSDIHRALEAVRLLAIPSRKSRCRPTLKLAIWSNFRHSFKPLSILGLRRLSNFLRVHLAPDGQQGAAPSARRLTPGSPGSPGKIRRTLDRLSSRDKIIECSEPRLRRITCSTCSWAWMVVFNAIRVAPTTEQPYGISYALVLRPKGR